MSIGHPSTSWPTFFLICYGITAAWWWIVSLVWYRGLDKRRDIGVAGDRYHPRDERRHAARMVLLAPVWLFAAAWFLGARFGALSGRLWVDATRAAPAPTTGGSDGQPDCDLPLGQRRALERDRDLDERLERARAAQLGRLASDLRSHAGEQLAAGRVTVSQQLPADPEPGTIAIEHLDGSVEYVVTFSDPFGDSS